MYVRTYAWLPLLPPPACIYDLDLGSLDTIALTRSTINIHFNHCNLS